MTKEQNYIKSNNILEISNLKLCNFTKKLYRKYREVEIITESMLQMLSDSILKDLELAIVPITFRGRRPHSTNGKRITRETHGVHKSTITISSINIYKFTAARQQLVSAKSAISTLLHEINHEIDKKLLDLNSIHSKGFYSRLKQLTINIA